MTSVDLSYLPSLLLPQGESGPDLSAATAAVAVAWRHAGVDVARVDLLAEMLARIARDLGEETPDETQVMAAVAFLELPPPVIAWLSAAMGQPRSAAQLAALAVHLVDINETLALGLFVPELPNLGARSERTGDDARRVGVARFLRG